MALERIGTVVLGATFLGAGYTLTHKDCLLLEPTAGLATDYVACMRRAVVREEEAVSQPGRTLHGEIVRRGLVNKNGLCHVFPTAGILSKLLLENHVPTLLDTVPTAIEKTADGFTVEAYGPDGRHTFSCSRILDTTPFGADILLEKTLGASLAAENETPVEIETDTFRVESGRFCGEGYFRVKLPFDATYTQARERLHTLWESEICAKLGGAFRLGAVASAFSYIFSHEYEETKDGARHLPSASFSSPLSAFEKGCAI